MRGTRAPRASRKVKDGLTEALEYVTRERQVLVFRQGRKGKLLAALVPLDDEKQLEALEDEVDRREANKTSARIRRGEEKTTPYEKVQRALGLA